MTNETFVVTAPPIQDEAVVETSKTTSSVKKGKASEFRKVMKIKTFESPLSELSLNNSSACRHHDDPKNNMLNIDIENIEGIRSGKAKLKRKSLKKRLLLWKKTKSNRRAAFSSDKSTAATTTNASFDDVLVCSCEGQQNQHDSRHEDADKEGVELVQTTDTSASEEDDGIVDLIKAKRVVKKNKQKNLSLAITTEWLNARVPARDENDDKCIVDGAEVDSTIVAIVEPHQLHEQQASDDDEEKRKLISFFDTYFEPFNGETMCGAGRGGGGCFCDGAIGPDDYFASVDDMIDHERIMKMTICTSTATRTDKHQAASAISHRCCNLLTPNDQLPVHTSSISSISSLGSIQSISDEDEDDRTMDLLNEISHSPRKRNKIKSSAAILHSKDEENRDLVFIISTNENFGINEDLVSIDLVLL